MLILSYFLYYRDVLATRIFTTPLTFCGFATVHMWVCEDSIWVRISDPSDMREESLQRFLQLLPALPSDILAKDAPWNEWVFQEAPLEHGFRTWSFNLPCFRECFLDLCFHLYRWYRYRYMSALWPQVAQNMLSPSSTLRITTYQIMTVHPTSVPLTHYCSFQQKSK